MYNVSCLRKYHTDAIGIQIHSTEKTNGYKRSSHAHSICDISKTNCTNEYPIISYTRKPTYQSALTSILLSNTINVELEPTLRSRATAPHSAHRTNIKTTLLYHLQTYKRYDSEISSISSSEGADDFDSPIWWDILDHEEEAIARYKKCLRERLIKEPTLNKKEEPEAMITKVEGMLSASAGRTMRCLLV